MSKINTLQDFEKFMNGEIEDCKDIQLYKGDPSTPDTLYDCLFTKVLFEQYKNDMIKTFQMQESDTLDELLKSSYDKIQLPKRSTSLSAGFDFFSPFEFTLKKGQTILIPTGIRCLIHPTKFLALVPRSGLGFKNRLQLANTVGIIDADYAYADNEGHIMIKIVYEGFEEETIENITINNIFVPCNFKQTTPESITIPEGKAFCQGIVIPYGIDEPILVQKKERKGGFGSTDSSN
jgi:dUTP pyrophosphatase